MLTIDIGLAILFLLLLITVFRVHPFVALLTTAVGMGLLAGMPLTKIADSIQTGFGNTIGFVGIVVGLGTFLGKLLEESGGARRIAQTMIAAFGPSRVHWAIYVVSFIVGIPVFFQVGFVLLIPLVFTITRELKIPALHVGIPMVASLSVVHGLLPPHPAALAAVAIFKADMGKTILYGILIGLPAATLAGPLFGTLIAPRFAGFDKVQMLDQSTSGQATAAPTSQPGFFISLFTTLLPVMLLLLATCADVFMNNTSRTYALFKLVGNPILALLISLIVAIYTFGIARGMSMVQIQKHAETSFKPIASILLIIGAGGAFSRVLIDSGAGTDIAQRAMRFNLNPIVFGWLVATLVRVATGSATVAMTTAAGIVAPLTSMTSVSPELMVIATGGGALMLSHVNDAGFWMVKEYFGVPLRLMFQTWTVLETIIGTSVLIFTLALDWALRTG